jgi:hypothetical protein
MVVSGGPAISTRQWLPARPRRYQRSRSPGSRSSPLCGLCHRLTPIEIIEDVLCINHVHKSCALCVLALAIARIIRRQAVPPLPTLGTITNNVHSSTGRSQLRWGEKPASSPHAPPTFGSVAPACWWSGTSLCQASCPRCQRRARYLYLRSHAGAAADYKIHG